MSKKSLVVYYTHSGNTKKIAELIAEKTGSTLFAIEPEKAYPTAYQAVVEQAKQEIRAGYRPALNSTIDVGDYNMVFVGSPNWWSTIAPPVASFLDEADFAGKTVVPFCTHGGGGMANVARDIAQLCPDSEVLNGFEIYGNGSARARGEVDTWLERIGIKL